MAPHLANEKIVLDQARAGDSTAFEALIGPYHHRLYRRALKITRNEEDAEDVVQDAELKAYCRLDRFQGSSRFYTWVTRIVINEALMKLRKRRSNRETESLEPVLIGKNQVEICRTSSPDEQPETYYVGVELRGILSGALAVLSPSLSAPFLLCFLEGYSLREIAALLGLSVPAIKSRLHRARNILSKRLRAMLQPPYPTPRSEA
jgi:RNA polymerase sigma-70 factor, ECF subfamily